MIITDDQLKAIIPGISDGALATYVPLLNQFMPKYDIVTPQRIGAFIAQVGHESASFSAVREFASGKEYEGRKDLGNTQVGDGEKFKGRGLIQITGRGNYKWCSESLYLDNRLLVSPPLLEQPAAATESACWYWKVVKPLNAVSDHPEDWTTVWKANGKTYTKIQWITLLVNGGQNGLAERTANYRRARQVLNF